MAYTMPQADVERMREFLRLHPIDHAWDEEAESLDGNIPGDQFLARLYDLALKEQEKREAENR